MTSVWYVGHSDSRRISDASWQDAGVQDAAGTFTWSRENGYSYPTTAFSTQQLAWLDAQDEEFWVGAPDGPRTATVLPADKFVTLNQLREFLSTYSFPTATGLTKASVGLGAVDNTSDANKPVSTAQAAALAAKADYPASGTNGQYLAKSGTTTVWVTPASSGNGVTITPVADPDMPDGYSYTISGTAVTQIADPDMPDGYSYRIG